MTKVSAILLLLVFLCGCSNWGRSASEERITISGAWALYPMMVRWSEEYREKHPGIIIDISAGGAGKGMTDALSGAVDLGMVSRDINSAEIERGAWWISVVKDAVIPTISNDNPFRTALLKRGLTRNEFSAIWIAGTITDWNSLVRGGGAAPMHVYTRSDACGAAETWAKYLGGSQEDLQGVGVFGDPGLADAVKNDRLGIGYNNINFAYDPKTKKPVAGITPLPLDINENGVIDPEENIYDDRVELMKAVADSTYPSPPARELHLVSRGAPGKKHVVRFLAWILGDGQRYVSEAGYIRLGKEALQKHAYALLKNTGKP